VYDGPVRTVAIGWNMSRMTCTSASARAISARPATSSGRDVNAALMADHEGGGCANVSDASAGTGPSASRARITLSIASAPRISLTSARASASNRATSTSARSTSDCGAVPLPYRAFAALTTSRANANCSDTSAAVRRRSCTMRKALAAWIPTSNVVRFASARRRSTSASAAARRCRRMPDNGICCSIVMLTSAPPSMNGR
jgi:hypothetical protein